MPFDWPNNYAYPLVLGACVPCQCKMTDLLPTAWSENHLREIGHVGMSKLD